MNATTPVSEYGARTANDTVRIERLLPGPVQRVWDHLVDADLRGRWLAGGEIEPRPGGRVALVFRNSSLTPGDDAPPAKYAHLADEARMAGRVTDFDPPRLLAYTWGEDEGEASHVRFELSEAGDRVRLVVTHSRIGGDALLLSIASGWHAHLDILRAHLDGDTPDGFWRTHTRLEAEYARRLGLPA